MKLEPIKKANKRTKFKQYFMFKVKCLLAGILYKLNFMPHLRQKGMVIEMKPKIRNPKF